jgi:hypothetical protein
MMAWAQPKPARQIAKEAFPSVVLVVMEDSHGQTTSLGSGFVLRDGQVVTNRHVISGAASGYVRLVDKDKEYEIAGTLAIDDSHDLAVLQVVGLKAPALPIGDSNQIAVGDEVYAIGNPRGLEGTFSQGIISALRHVGGDTIFQMTAPISPGSSGGPILNSGGKLIGIAVATYTGGQNLNLAIPVSYLTALIGGISGEVRPLSGVLPSSPDHVIGVPKGTSETFKHLMMKAEAGDAHAQVRVGNRYAVGNGVGENDIEAVRWYRMAAEQGNAEGQYLLAGRYASGRGIPRDYQQALFWTSLAALIYQGLPEGRLYGCWGSSCPAATVIAEDARTLGFYAAGKLTTEQRAEVRSLLAKKAAQALDLPWFQQ